MENKLKNGLREYLRNKDSNFSERLDVLWNYISPQIHSKQTGKQSTESGHEHCASVEKNIWEFIKKTDRINEFKDIELFILSCAACCHDFDKGLLINKYKNGSHGIGSASYIYDRYRELNVSKPEALAITEIVKIHGLEGKKYKNALHDLKKFLPIGNKRIKLQLLAVIFKVGDILDLCSQRASDRCVEPNELEDFERSKFLFRYTNCGWEIDGSRIKVTSCIDNSEQKKAFNHCSKYLLNSEWNPIKEYLNTHNFPYELYFEIMTRSQINKDEHIEIYRDPVPGLNPVHRFSSIPGEINQILFVYGSLLNPVSANRTLLKSKLQIEYIPAKLSHFKLKLGIPQKKRNMVDKDFKSLDDANWMSFTIENTDDWNDQVPGALIQVNDEDKALLIEREHNYTLIDISNYIEVLSNCEKPGEEILAFAPKQNGSATHQNEGKNTQNSIPNQYIRKRYFEMVNHSLTKLGFLNSDLFYVPDNVSLLEGYDADELAASICQIKSDETVEIWKNLQAHLISTRGWRIVNNKRIPIKAACRPIFFSPSFFREICKISENTVAICEKALIKVLNDQQLQKKSGFRKEDILLGKLDLETNNSLIPQIARVDLTFSREGLNILEVNSDSPGGMFHLDLLFDYQEQICRKYELFNADIPKTRICKYFIEYLKEYWKNFCKKRNSYEKPLQTIIILEQDWKRWSTRTEFEQFRRLFRKEGIEAEIVEPNQLATENNKILFNNKPVDLIYKRILWQDLIEFPEAEKNILNAFRCMEVCVVNSLGSRLIGNKFLFSVIKDDHIFGKEFDNIDILVSRDRYKTISYIPWTVDYNDCSKEDNLRIEKNLDHFVFKPFHGFGGDGIIFGESWKPSNGDIKKLKGKDYIAQKKIRHGKSLMPECDENECSSFVFNNYVIGAYVIGGRCIALEAKLSKTTNIINVTNDAARTPILTIKERRHN